MSWTGSTRDEPGRGARPTVDRRRCRPKAPERSGTLTGVWPPGTSVHESSPAGAQQRAGARLGPHRSSIYSVATRRRWGKRRRRKSSVTAVLVLQERGKSAVGRCGEGQGSHCPFIGVGARRRGVAGGE
jgi:hypothetical protein